jgi:hypothetical protein
VNSLCFPKDENYLNVGSPGAVVMKVQSADRENQIIIEKVADALIDDDWASLLQLILQFSRIIMDFRFQLSFTCQPSKRISAFRLLLSDSAPDSLFANVHWLNSHLIFLSAFLGSQKCFRKLRAFSSKVLSKEDKIILIKSAAIRNNLAIFREVYHPKLLKRNHEFTRTFISSLTCFDSFKILKFLFLNGENLVNAVFHISPPDEIRDFLLFPHTDIVKFCLEQCSFITLRLVYNRIVERCCQESSMETLEYLLNLHHTNSIDLENLIFYAVIGGSLQVFKLLYRKIHRLK